MLDTTMRCGILLLVCLLNGIANADDRGTVADRTPLTFRDSGVYCNYGFVHGPSPESDGVSNLLPADRAATDASPWSFYVMQYSVHNGSRLDDSLIERMAANGKKVILRIRLKPPKQVHELDLEDCQNKLSEILNKYVKPQWLYAITLGEENVYWYDNIRVLSDLYHWCKSQWPNLPVYQWWTPMEVPDVRAKSGWVALPADGWMIDLYLMAAKEFERKLLKTMETGKPVIHIVWSSPTWPIYRKGDHDIATWWDAVGQGSFQEQVDICRGYNIPVGHFVVQPHEVVDGKVINTIRWAWQSIDLRVREHYNTLETYALNLKHIPDGSFGYRVLDEATYNWAHVSEQPHGIVYSVDDLNRQMVTTVIGKEQLSRETHVQRIRLPMQPDGLAIGCRILASSPAFLSRDLEVTSRAGTVVRVPIELQVAHTGIRGDLVFEIDVAVYPSRGGAAELRYATRKRGWSKPISAKNEKGKQTLRFVVSEAERAGEKYLHFEIALTGAAGVDTKVASRLEEIRIKRVYKTLSVVYK